MKGYTIRESIDRLEKRGGGSGGGSAASDISFNKTGTSLAATNVQTAIAEVDANVSANVADIEQLQLDEVDLEHAVLPAAINRIKIGEDSTAEYFNQYVEVSNITLADQEILTLETNEVVERCDGMAHHSNGSDVMVGSYGTIHANVYVTGGKVHLVVTNDITSAKLWIMTSIKKE